ncbi:MAG: hypothetical protein RIC56_20505 [Pseudomonadales bacterium]
MSDQLNDTPDGFSVLRADLDRLAEDAESLAKSFDRGSALAREEVVGAELLASREVVAQLGVAWETMAQLGDLYARQARYLVEDNVATFGKLLDGSAQGRFVEVLGEHCQRRLGHLGEGVDESIEVLSRQSEAASSALEMLWAPFVAVVRRDWQGQRSNRRRNANIGTAGGTG